MAIRFRCPQCDQLMSIGSRMAGQTVRCPGCQQDVLVPSGEAVESAPWLPDESSTETVSDPSLGRLPAHEPAQELPPEPAVPVATPARRHVANEDEGGFSLRKAQVESEEMDLTPMVDMTFLLLIFFMVTASFSVHKTIQVPTPDPEERGATQSMQRVDDLIGASITVDVDEHDVIRIDEEPLSSPGDLVDALRERMRSEQKVEMLLRASENARHEMIVTVVDAGNAVGMQHIRMLVASGDDAD
jgi:biopolymer transport protein ExbD